MWTVGGLWLTYVSKDGETCATCDQLVDSVHLFHGDRLRGLDDEEFYALYGRLRHSMGNHLVCYYHLLALHDVGRLVHVADSAGGAAQIDFAAVFDNVRLLCFILFHVMRRVQKEIRRRAASRVEDDGSDASMMPGECVVDEPEFRWLFKDYVQWCKHFTHAYMMKADLIVQLMDLVSKWDYDDVLYMMRMRRQLEVLKHVYEFDVDVVLHVQRPLDMTPNMYPTLELLHYYESRMRGVSGVEYKGIIQCGGYGAFPRFDANSF